jgi:hypothetical protein
VAPTAVAFYTLGDPLVVVYYVTPVLVMHHYFHGESQKKNSYSGDERVDWMN